MSFPDNLLFSLNFYLKFYLLIHLARVCMHATEHRWRSENSMSPSSPSTVWVAVVKLRLSGLVTNALSLSAKQFYQLFSKTVNEWFAMRKMKFTLKIQT